MSKNYHDYENKTITGVSYYVGKKIASKFFGPHLVSFSFQEKPRQFVVVVRRKLRMQAEIQKEEMKLCKLLWKKDTRELDQVFIDHFNTMWAGCSWDLDVI